MFIFKMHLLAPFTDQNDRSSYPFIYFNQLIPHTFIYLRPEKGTLLGGASMSTVSIIGRGPTRGGGGPSMSAIIV